MRDKQGDRKLYFLVLLLLAGLLAWYNPYVGIAAAGVIGALMLYSLLRSKKHQEEWTSYLETLSLTMDRSAKAAISNLPIPLCMVKEDGKISWYNRKFTEMVQRRGMMDTQLIELFPTLGMDSFLPEQKEKIALDLEYQNKKYQVLYYYASDLRAVGETGTLMLYFMDVTQLDALQQAYAKNQPGVLVLQVDSLDEVLNSAEESQRPVLQLMLDKGIREWLEAHQCAYTVVGKDRYLAVTQEYSLKDMERNKFSLLDTVRSIEVGNTLSATLTIGASPFTGNLMETQRIAEGALDLGLGRGGDQSVVKRDDRCTFYGGRTKAVEKKTRVRARIIAYALRDLIAESKYVLIMGHINPDLDAIGSAMGIMAIAKMMGKKAHIVLERSNASIDALYRKIVDKDMFRDLFVNKDKAYRMASEGSLLVVVDTNRPSFTEYPKLIDLCDRVVLVDHHRRGVEFLEKAVLVYHETYASSTSEMVTEMVQYIKDKPYVDALVAEALLAGITLDTRNFVFKTGVRTFEAAAFLKRFGADSIAVKTLFQGDMEQYILNADIVKTTEIIGEHYALGYYDKIAQTPQLTAAQAADELLNLKGVHASFVLTENEEGTVYISARSLTNINVQVIMEKLGGGGHLETAAAQLKGITLQQGVEQVKKAIQEYRREDEVK